MKKFPDRERKMGWCMALLESISARPYEEGRKEYWRETASKGFDFYRRDLPDHPWMFSRWQKYILLDSFRLPKSAAKEKNKILYDYVLGDLSQEEMDCRQPLDAMYNYHFARMKIALQKIGKASQNGTPEEVRAEKIEAIAKALGIGHDKLAEAAGVDVEQLERWLSTEDPMPDEVIEPIAERLHITPLFLA